MKQQEERNSKTTRERERKSERERERERESTRVRLNRRVPRHKWALKTHQKHKPPTPQVSTHDFVSPPKVEGPMDGGPPKVVDHV